jgi:hypothetical protein
VLQWVFSSASDATMAYAKHATHIQIKESFGDVYFRLRQKILDTCNSISLKPDGADA